MEEYFSMRIFSFDFYLVDMENENIFLNKNKFDYLNKNPDISLHEYFKNESSEENYNYFMDRKIKQTTILRIFGSTFRGQKCCLNIHNYFPYFFIEINNDNYFPFENQLNLRQFAEILETIYLDCISICESNVDFNNNSKSFDRKIINKGSKASFSSKNFSKINHLQSNISKNLIGKKFTSEQIIHKIEVVEKINFYGYNKCEGIFLKISLYNPKSIPLLMEILNKGTIDGKHYQCFEAHLSLCMHFFTDFNLYGMSLIKFNKFTFRYALKDKINLRNDIENYNGEIINSDSEQNFLFCQNNIIWSNDLYSLNKEKPKNQININADNTYESIYNEKEKYFNLINFSRDLKIWDFDLIKHMHGKICYNNLKYFFIIFKNLEKLQNAALS